MFSIIKFIIYSNLWLASAAGLLTYAIAQQIGTASLAYFGFAFGAVLFIYNVHQLFRIRELDLVASNRHKWAKKHLSVIVLIAVIGVGLALVSFISSFMTVLGWGFVLLFGVVSILYSFRVRASVKTLRELPYLKIHFIALTWTASTAIFPLVFSESTPHGYIYLIASFYCFFIAITIPFDIRDLGYDFENQKTIPQILGVQKAIYLAKGLLLVSYLLLSLYSISITVTPLSLITLTYTFLVLVLARKKQSELFYVAVIDGAALLLGFSFLLV
jgi:hypothetical protein